VGKFDPSTSAFCGSTPTPTLPRKREMERASLSRRRPHPRKTRSCATRIASGFSRSGTTGNQPARRDLGPLRSSRCRAACRGTAEPASPHSARIGIVIFSPASRSPCRLEIGIGRRRDILAHRVHLEDPDGAEVLLQRARFISVEIFAFSGSHLLPEEIRVGRQQVFRSGKAAAERSNDTDLQRIDRFMPSQ